VTVLQKGNAIYPFWGASINLITGLDPLGLQTTSEATYAAILPGISNLTNRLRYYGFYCWLLDFYFKKERKGNSSEQYKFIRRAELMIALIMQTERKDIQQITGSNYAANLIISQSGNEYDLAAGADLIDENSTVYWKYPSGAFGQYYYGAMRAISLVVAASNEENDVIYTITQPHPRQRVSGQELANAFDSTLTLTIKELFYSNIKIGILKVDDIQELAKYFFIDKVNENSPEWNLYAAMLYDKDDPSQELEDNFTFHRRETIRVLIDNAIENGGDYNWHKLLLKAYELKLKPSTNPVNKTLIGWYAYQFNEYYQFACGAIFWATLQHLYSFQQDQYLPTFVKEWSSLITNDLHKEIQEIQGNGTLKQVLSGISDQLTEDALFNSIETKYSSSPIEAAKKGFLLLFQLYNQNKEFLIPLKEFMIRNEMLREGNVIDGLLSFVTAENDQLKLFVEQFLVRKIIYRHQMVALRKMGNGSQSTHKFIIEEQFIRFIDNFPPKSTSPRMNAMWNLLSDLKVIDLNNKLTSLYPILIGINGT